MGDPLDVAVNAFVNDERELRCGWRVLVFAFCLIVVVILLSGLARALAIIFPAFDFLLTDSSASELESGRELLSLVFAELISLTAAAISTAICARFLERRSFASVAFKLHRRWSRDFVIGSALGAASLAIAVGIATAAGAATFELNQTEAADLARGFVIVALVFIITGAKEELIFRGFPFQALAHNLGGPAAVAISSVVFGLAHLSNPNSTTFSTLNTVLAGVWLGLAYLMTRSLWLPTGLHWSWNFSMVFIFGLPVSGLTAFSQFSWLRGIVGPPFWISGGSYGPEGGIAVTVALMLSTLAIWKSGLFTPTEEMISAIKHGKREPELLSVTPEQHQAPDALVETESPEHKDAIF